MRIAPLLQCAEHDSEVTPRRREVIFGTYSITRELILALFEDARGDKFAQPGDQHVCRDAEIRLEVGEPGYPGVRLAKNQQRPALADYGEGPFDRTLSRGRLVKRCRSGHWRVGCLYGRVC